jgi:hypothetical protein
VNESGLEDLSDPNSFKGPPIGFDAGTGRAHWKGRNVFYGSADATTSILEKKFNDKNEVEFFLSKWEIDVDKIKMKEMFLANFISKDLPDINPWKLLSEGFDETVKDLRIKHGKDFSDRFEHLIIKVYELFLSANPNSYPISGFIANQIIYSNKGDDNILLFPILLYPSNVRKSVDSNFAIHPHFVDQYMKLVNVLKFKAIGLNKENPTMLPSAFGVNNGKIIKWYNFKEVYGINQIKCSCCNSVLDLNDKVEFIVGEDVFSEKQVVELLMKYDEQQNINTIDFFSIVGLPTDREFENEIVFQNLKVKYAAKVHECQSISYRVILNFFEI